MGAIVLAAAEGIVARVRDDSEEYGDDPSYGPKANYLSVVHGDEISEYLHLAHDSTLVKAGDKVVKGQQLATTGLSGWMTAPHLHFMVYKAGVSYQDFQCLQIRFGQ